MSNPIEVVVPDIGNFDSVDVIEVLVKPGDVIAREDSLITLESDKASMEIPSSHAGTVKALQVKVGDKVSQGTVILLLDAATDAAAAEPAAAEQVAAAATPAADVPSPAPSATAPAGDSDLHAEVVVLGSGPGGYTAAFRAPTWVRRWF